MSHLHNRPICYDLHSHSICSDGDLTPAELVQRAAAQGVDVLALTDHDELAGLAEAQLQAHASGLTLIDGVEISVSWQKKLIHIVGLGIDPEAVSLQLGLQQLREKRQWRAQAMAEKLEKAGFENVLTNVRRYAKGNIISRTHFGHYLVDIGAVKNFKAAFKRYLLPGKPGYVDCQWASLDEAVQWINDAGGQAVIAHPARYQISRQGMLALIDDFKAAGGCGFEVISSCHNPAENRRMAELANSTGLLASKGSDFHSPGNVWAELGRLPSVPDSCQLIWQSWSLRSDRLQAQV